MNRLIVDVYPHSQYQARVVLEEIPDEENPDFMLCSLSIYMAPEQAMQTYLQDMVYESQTHTVKKLGVDTARYYLGVDDRDDIIRTGGNGYWGAYHEMTRMIRGHIHLDATILTIVVPFPVSWTVKMKKKQKETQDILSYHSQAAGCSDKARAKASGGRQPIEECGRTGL